jgi:hypothetical protein
LTLTAFGEKRVFAESSLLHVPVEMALPLRRLGWWESEMVTLNINCFAVLEISTSSIDLRRMAKAIRCVQLQHAMMQVNVTEDPPKGSCSSNDDGQTHTVPEENTEKHFRYVRVPGNTPFEAVCMSSLREFGSYFDARVQRLCVYGTDQSLFSVEAVMIADADVTRLIIAYTHAVGDGTSGQIIGCEIAEYYSRLLATTTRQDEDSVVIEAAEATATHEAFLATLAPDPEVQAFGGDDRGPGLLSASDAEAAAKLSAILRSRKEAHVAKLDTVALTIPPIIDSVLDRVPNSTTLFRGSDDPAVFTAILARCRKRGITIGSLISAALHFAARATVNNTHHCHTHGPSRATTTQTFAVACSLPCRPRWSAVSSACSSCKAD